MKIIKTITTIALVAVSMFALWFIFGYDPKDQENSYISGFLFTSTGITILGFMYEKFGLIMYHFLFFGFNVVHGALEGILRVFKLAYKDIFSNN